MVYVGFPTTSGSRHPLGVLKPVFRREGGCYTVLLSSQWSSGLENCLYLREAIQIPQRIIEHRPTRCQAPY